MFYAYAYGLEKKDSAETSSTAAGNSLFTTKVKFSQAYNKADLKTLTEECQKFLEDVMYECSMPQLAFALRKLYADKGLSDILGAVNHTYNKLISKGADEMSLQDVLEHCKWPLPTTTASSSSSTASSPSSYG